MKQNANSQEDLDSVILVNKDDEIIGSDDKVTAHYSPGLLHRASSVFLFNDNSQLLIQQRSRHKIVAAGKWANTVCGNVHPNESYLECAQRRLRQELGIDSSKIKLEPLGKFQYQVDFTNGFSEREIDQVFAGSFDGLVKPDPSEVANIDWVSWINLFQEDFRQYAPWLKIILDQDDIRKKLEKIIQCKS